MLQTFHAVPIRAAVTVAPARVINGLKDNTTVAIEIDYDFEWLLQVDET